MSSHVLDQRAWASQLANLRLLGLSPLQTRAVAFTEAATSAVAGVLLGALLFRRSMEAVLGDLVEVGDATDGDAVRIADLVARENARRVYGL